jgi:DNA mismatch repair ATPase MutL
MTEKRNALDAEATSIDVKLVDNGVDAIHVR